MRSSTCLRIQAQEKVTLITDRACSEIAAALANELERLRLRYNAWVLEDLAPRPLKDMPREVLEDMETSDVSIFAVKAQENELRTRMQMTDVVNRRKMRHAHMVNIDRRIMLEGMRADFDEVDRISTQVWTMASAGPRDPRHQSGRHRHRRPFFAAIASGSRPAASSAPTSGATCRAAKPSPRPSRVDGTFVIDGVVGDYLCEKYGDLGETPLTIRSRRTTA